jgi:hypothetical protein
MQEKGHDVLFQPRRNLDFAVYVQSFRLIQWNIAFLFKILYQDCPNVPNWFINNVALSSNNSMVLFHCNSYCKLDSVVRLTMI